MEVDEDSLLGGHPLDLKNVKVPTGGTGVQHPYRGIEGEVFSLKWQSLDNSCDRLRVYGGWLVKYAGYEKGGLCFIPDHDGRWVISRT